MEPKSPIDTIAYRFNAFDDIKTYTNPLPPSSGFSGTIVRTWKIKNFF
jgi:hypothetical protein